MASPSFTARYNTAHVAVAVNLASAGTIELLVDEPERYSFIEMSTRIQKGLNDPPFVAGRFTSADGARPHGYGREGP